MVATFKMNETDSARKALNLMVPWKKREKQANEATPPSINIWKQPVYSPPTGDYIRPSGLDHRKYKSKG